jgi:hypothetical protein
MNQAYKIPKLLSLSPHEQYRRQLEKMNQEANLIREQKRMELKSLKQKQKINEDAGWIDNSFNKYYTGKVACYISVCNLCNDLV